MGDGLDWAARWGHAAVVSMGVCMVLDGCCTSLEVAVFVWRVCGPGNGVLSARTDVDGMWVCMRVCCMWVAGPWMTLWLGEMEDRVGWVGMDCG